MALCLKNVKFCAILGHASRIEKQVTHLPTDVPTDGRTHALVLWPGVPSNPHYSVYHVRCPARRIYGFHLFTWAGDVFTPSGHTDPTVATERLIPLRAFVNNRRRLSLNGACTTHRYPIFIVEKAENGRQVFHVQRGRRDRKHKGRRSPI